MIFRSSSLSAPRRSLAKIFPNFDKVVGIKSISQSFFRNKEFLMPCLIPIICTAMNLRHRLNNFWRAQMLPAGNGNRACMGRNRTVWKFGASGWLLTNVTARASLLKLTSRSSLSLTPARHRRRCCFTSPHSHRPPQITVANLQHAPNPHLLPGQALFPAPRRPIVSVSYKVWHCDSTAQ